MENSNVKLSENGVKLPYFHRTLTPEEKALIGDITPKQINTKGKDGASTDSSVAVGTSGSGSAWNSAMTWEEKNCTSWATEKLPTLFCEEYSLGNLSNYDITIKSFSNAAGNAQITHVRGKARFMYELSFNLSFTAVSASGNEYSGTVAVEDVINDQLDDIELGVTWTVSPPGAELLTIRNALLKGGANGGSLKRLIKERMVVFEADFRNSV